MVRIPTLIPTDFWFRSVLILIIYFGLSIFWFYGKSSFTENGQFYKVIIYSLSFLIPISIFDLYLRRGYRVAYDNDAVHWRKVGFSRSPSKQIVMPYNVISHVFGEPGTLRVKPFEAVVLHADGQDVADIVLSRMYLRDGDISDLLLKVSEKSGAAFEEEVRDFMMDYRN